jgi:hypothetical protein
MRFYCISELVNTVYHNAYKEGMEKYVFVLNYETKDEF